jgi:phosphatidylserine decarboxylase
MRGAWTEDEDDLVDGKTYYHNAVDNSGTRILVQDRGSGLIVQENIPTYLKAAMRLFYRTSGGRLLLNKALGTLKAMTERQGRAMDNPKSRENIPSFIKTHNLNVDEMLLPLDQFKTFNEFFYRKLKPGARIVDEPDNPNVAVSPADSRMMVFRTLDDSQTLWIKGEHFTLSNLFGGWDKTGEHAKLFAGGSLVIARLAPQDYHRWHFPVGGSVRQRYLIDGAYMTVNPIAVRKNVDVYTLNKRCICPVDTKEFGLVVLIAVAATAVGSINFDLCDCKSQSPCVDGVCQVGKKVKKFDNHGYFAFGGSTTLVLFQPGVIAFDSDLLRNSDSGLETLVKVGSRIGVAAKEEQKEKTASNDSDPKQKGAKK